MDPSHPHDPASPRNVGRLREIAVLLVCLAGAAILATHLDLEPRVESDFFFASDDPQLLAAREIGRLFPSSPQILVASRSPDPFDEEALDRTRRLTDSLLALEGVQGVRSLTRGPASPEVVPRSPVWSRLLLGEDPGQALLVVELAEPAGRAVVERVEDVLEEADRPSFSLAASGVPWVVEQVRRRLSRDLRVFSFASLLLLLGVSLVLHRSLSILLGTAATCAASIAATLALLRLLDVPVGLLTANLATIVFVLTLSHTLFLGAARRRVDLVGGAARRAVIREVVGPSFWCMATTLCGFLSLLLAEARPLRELGLAGSVGTLTAFVAAYGIFPLFLSDPWPGRGPDGAAARALPERRRPAAGWTLAVGAIALFASLGVPSVVTDPPLTSFFAAGDPIRSGLERIDRSGGSSPLELVVSDPEGAPLDDHATVDRLAELQEALERHPDVATSLSLPLLLEEARRNPLAAFLDTPSLIGVLAGPMFGGVAGSFLTEDRTRARFLLRMRELGRETGRRDVVRALTEEAANRGFEVRLVGGLYDLQGRLGELVSGSLVRGLGGLLLLFVAIGALVARDLRAALVMGVALASVPVTLVGFAGWFGRPLDLVAAPGINVAIAIGVDAMIHLAMTARRSGGDAAAWALARRRLSPPIVEAALLVALGFGVFGLSSFPPTRRFGLLVAGGALLAATVALQVVPRWAGAVGSGEAGEGFSDTRSSRRP